MSRVLSPLTLPAASAAEAEPNRLAIQSTAAVLQSVLRAVHWSVLHRRCGSGIQHIARVFVAAAAEPLPAGGLVRGAGVPAADASG